MGQFGGYGLQPVHQSTNINGALQAAEKLIERVSRSRFVSGHDFSRAAIAVKTTRPLGPEGCFRESGSSSRLSSAASLATEEKFIQIAPRPGMGDAGQNASRREAARIAQGRGPRTGLRPWGGRMKRSAILGRRFRRFNPPRRGGLNLGNKSFLPALTRLRFRLNRAGNKILFSKWMCW